jgi:hypothetical protein
MRLAIAAGIALVSTSVWAQTVPGLTREQIKAIPPEVLKSLPMDVLTKIPPGTLKEIPPDLFANVPPSLLAKIPPNAATMTPEQAKAYYRGLDPVSKQSLKQQGMEIKTRLESVPGLKDKLKALWASMKGS